MSFLGRLRRRRSRRGEDNAESTDFVLDTGELLEAQGRCLDEANANLHTVQKENSVLRDRLSCAISSSSSQSRLPLRNMTNHTCRDQQSKLLVEENRLLNEQAAILSAELRDANRSLVEKDSNIASLGKSLAACIEKSRRLLEEKSSLEEALLVKKKEHEGSLANESRLNSIIMDLEANAKSSLKERDEVMKDAASHAQMADGLTRSLEKAQSSLLSKQAEVENLSRELAASKRDAASALQESEAALSLRRSLSISTARNEKLEREAEETKARLEDSKIAQHSLRVSHDHMQAEMQEIIKSHKACVSEWTNSQDKALGELNEGNTAQVNELHKRLSNLNQVNSSLEGDLAACQRDLQSAEQDCACLRKLIASSQNKHEERYKELADAKSQVDRRLESSHSSERAMKDEIARLKDECDSVMISKVAAEAKHKSQAESAQKELIAHRELVKTLKEQAATYKSDANLSNLLHEKETERVKDESDRHVRDVMVQNEALVLSAKAAKIALSKSDSMREKEKALHEATVDKLLAEKRERVAHLNQSIQSERETSQKLMQKTQEVSTAVNQLKSLTLQQRHEICQHKNSICILERTIANGEAKLGLLGKSLSVSITEQESLLLKEEGYRRQIQALKQELGH